MPAVIGHLAVSIVIGRFRSAGSRRSVGISGSPPRLVGIAERCGVWLGTPTIVGAGRAACAARIKSSIDRLATTGASPCFRIARPIVIDGGEHLACSLDVGRRDEKFNRIDDVGNERAGDIVIAHEALYASAFQCSPGRRGLDGRPVAGNRHKLVWHGSGK
jgi:hypothetical protein